MKKINFYTLKAQGVESVSGYTDGTFNYYTSGGNSYNGWAAILPDCGLSVCFANTRKKCAEIAHSAEMQEKLNSPAAVMRRKERAEIFDKMTSEV